MIRSATSIECKLKIRSIPVNHLRFMRVHDAAHATVEGGASQQAHVIPGSSQKCDRTESVSVDLELEQQEDRENGAQQLGC